MTDRTVFKHQTYRDPLCDVARAHADMYDARETTVKAMHRCSFAWRQYDQRSIPSMAAHTEAVRNFVDRLDEYLSAMGEYQLAIGLMAARSPAETIAQHEAMYADGHECAEREARP